MVDLKPCPFCGGSVSCVTVIGDWYEDGEPTGGDSWSWSIRHNVKNSRCTLRSFHEFGEFRTLECDEANEQKQRLLEAWNTRAERTCENVTDNKDANQFECSKCHCIVKDSEDYYVNVYERGKFSKGNTYGWNYCPNCGKAVKR